MPNAQNYMEQGGASWKIGGTLEIKSGAELIISNEATVTGLSGAPAAHTHAETDVTGLTDALAGKIDKVPAATASRIAVFDAEGGLADGGETIGNLALRNHQHMISGIYQLQNTLNLKADKTYVDERIAANVTLAADADADGVRTALLALLAAMKASGAMTGDA